MHFDGTITAGELLQIISFLLAVFAAYNRITIKISILETKLTTIYDWWEDEVRKQAGDHRNRKIRTQE